jgi:hypothetical protein
MFQVRNLKLPRISKGRTMGSTFFLPGHHKRNLILLFLFALFFCGSWSCSQMTGREAGERKELGETKMGQQVSGDYRPQEVIVKFKDDVPAAEIERIAGSENLGIIKVLPRRVYLFRITGSSSVTDTIEALKRRKEVEYAEPNYIERVK